MEHNSSSSLFNLTIDPLTKSHLYETAKWARFLSIVGFVLLFFVATLGLYYMSLFNQLSSSPFESSEPTTDLSSSLYILVPFVIIVVIWFFPLLFLIRFSSNLKTALINNDQINLNVSLQNLKACFRYVSILTLIIVTFYTLVFVLQFISGTNL